VPTAAPGLLPSPCLLVAPGLTTAAGAVSLCHTASWVPDSRGGMAEAWVVVMVRMLEASRCTG
jgi:hypothetical protein